MWWSATPTRLRTAEQKMIQRGLFVCLKLTLVPRPEGDQLVGPLPLADDEKSHLM
jgi:hypothetical protein